MRAKTISRFLQGVLLAMGLAAIVPTPSVGQSSIDNTCASCSRRLLDSLNVHKIHNIRVNQVGYRTIEGQKIAFVANGTSTPKSPNFQVVRENGSVAYTGKLAYLGDYTSLKAKMLVKGYFNSVTTLYSFGDSTKSTGGEFLWKADFGPLKEEGSYRVAVGSDTSLPFEIREDIYNDVFQTSLKFFGAQRCGDTKSWLHKACHKKDGSAIGKDLSGGWHDCGDHGKYGETEGYAASMLALAYAAMPEKAEDQFGESYNDTLPFGNDGIPDLLWEAKVGADYIYKLYVASKEKGLIASGDMYHSVGTGPGADHNYWDVPENQDAQPYSRGGPDRIVSAGIGSNVAGMYITNLALVGWGWEPFDPVYAKKLRDAAEDIYANVMKKKLGKSTSQPCCYSGGGQMQDDPALAAVALWFATGKSDIYGFDLYRNTAIHSQAGQSQWDQGVFPAGFLGAAQFHHGGWTTDFQQVNVPAVYAFGKLILKDTATARKFGLSATERDSLLQDVLVNIQLSISTGSNGTDKETFKYSSLQNVSNGNGGANPKEKARRMKFDTIEKGNVTVTYAFVLDKQ